MSHKQYPTRVPKPPSKVVVNCSVYGAQATERKQAQKANPTKAEIAFRDLLNRLRINHQFQRVVFTEKRYFICDFVVWTKPKLIIEIDGGSHQGREAYDAMRTRLIEGTKQLGRWTVIRITNEQVFNGQAVEILREYYPRQFTRWWDAPPLPRQPTKQDREGPPCKKCGKPTLKFTHDGPQPGKQMWYAWWFRCRKCKWMLMPNEARRP